MLEMKPWDNEVNNAQNLISIRKINSILNTKQKFTSVCGCNHLKPLFLVTLAEMIILGPRTCKRYDSIQLYIYLGSAKNTFGAESRRF